MKIILKADDLAGYPGKNKIIPKRWQRFVDIIEKYNIKANIGIIGNSLIFDDEKYFEWIKKYNDTYIEFWNHGFLHRKFNFDAEEYYEFKGTTKEYQLQLIEYTNNLAKNKLGFNFKTFGAPYNAVDFNTSLALKEANIKYGFFLKDNFEGVNLTNRIDFEYNVGIGNFQKFKKVFTNLDYAVIQIHPNMWSNEVFNEFENTILFLLKKKCEFVFAKDM
jgi:peptidoglycan/xylan/chitin deacetylase (PgdA/CDA1 family)